MRRLLWFTCVFAGCGGGGHGDGSLWGDLDLDAGIIVDSGIVDTFVVDAPYTTSSCPIAPGTPGSCDPLTQCWSGPSPEACGSTNPSMPDRGCFGYDSFDCSATSAANLTLTDRAYPRTDPNGAPYLNGCAPGFIPLFYSTTGSTTTLCTGFCAALETDNTPAHRNNGLGDPTALAKLPLQATPVAGNATCAPGKKGSASSSRCKFLWPYLEDDATGELPAAFAASSLVDTLGVCFAVDNFLYDSNGDMTPDAPYPDCATLPRRSSATPGDADDAADWGCLKRSSSGFARRAPQRDVWIGRGAVPVARHSFD
ncbi:MAG: hypothetical protein AB7T06_48055 [Kofleriaceae bacterium]